jgi:Protein of unknown function (DUF2851)
MSLSFPYPEKLLHYIWQFQLFDKQNLQTSKGDGIDVLQIGQLNTNAGPDFQEAKIQIGKIIWVGNIEIHINSADWYVHNHDQNQDFDSIILHVVWDDNGEIIRKNGQEIPVLCLKNRVNKKLLNDYKALMENNEMIPCFSQFKMANSITKTLMLERALVNRLERKGQIVLQVLKANNYNWEETTYQILAKTMGFGLNSIPFERLARLVPLKILQKHQDNLTSIEALLFGAAGFLNDLSDQYGLILAKEYDFLKAKYGITNEIKKHEWKFMRTRPANFPTVRIAQFAQLLQNTKSLFSYFLLFENPVFLKNTFKLKPNAYWESRYNFGESTTEKQNGMGNDSIENILINAVAPILVAYSIEKKEHSYIEKAMNLLEALKPEKNKITRTWDQLNFSAQNAAESQGSIELYNEFCLKKACLTCNIGVSILR